MIFHRLLHPIFCTLSYPVCFRSAFYTHFRAILFNKHLTRNTYQVTDHSYNNSFDKLVKYLNLNSERSNIRLSSFLSRGHKNLFVNFCSQQTSKFRTREIPSIFLDKNLSKINQMNRYRENRLRTCVVNFYFHRCKDKFYKRFRSDTV